jgi:hypothetical protein
LFALVRPRPKLAVPGEIAVLLPGQPKLVTPVLQVVPCVIKRNLLWQAGLKAG